ncbi:hypothetical protein [Rhizobium sp. BK251]|uniref:hypothetical protein n=1 Tax=Rhizobium sp. BK251 TaxID=2512125 RepID=UPI00104EC36A|nr:hypothetical protein [Rhizobium sp. BK251]TCL70664.1 hypothetical protein EV286_107542 [Rhizobium sp. BK251]
MLIGLSNSLCQFQRSGATDPNLLAGLSWQAGSNTTLSIVGNVARGAAIGTNNPRVLKGPVALLAGVTYRYRGDVKIGTTPAGARFRISQSPDLASDHFVDLTFSSDTSYDATFSLISPTDAYVGVVGVGNSDGQWIGIATDFSLVRVS